MIFIIYRKILSSSGDTLSLKQLGTVKVRTTSTGSGVSLNTINSSVGVTVKLSEYDGGSIGSVSGFTYVVENTSETYRLTFNSTGSKFSQMMQLGVDNFTWRYQVVLNYLYR